MLEVSSSGYYVWCGRPASGREMANQALLEQVEAVFDVSGETYGSPRVYRELQREGVLCSENRVARLMRLRGLIAK